MEDWVLITDASWEGILSPEEQAILTPQQIAAALTNMAAEIRTMITTWSPNTVSANPLKIPAGFMRQALIVARDSLLTGLPGYTQDEERKTQTKAANAWFLEVARGKIRPQPASDAIANEVPSEIPAGVQVVSAPGSRTGRARMNGI